MRKIADQRWRDVNEIVMAFELEQPGDLADYDIIRRKSKLGAEFGVIGGGQKGLEVEAAPNLSVLRWPSNSGCKVLLFHRIGHDDEMGRGFGSALFGVTKR